MVRALTMVELAFAPSRKSCKLILPSLSCMYGMWVHTKNTASSEGQEIIVIFALYTI